MMATYSETRIDYTHQIDPPLPHACTPEHCTTQHPSKAILALRDWDSQNVALGYLQQQNIARLESGAQCKVVSW